MNITSKFVTIRVSNLGVNVKNKNDDFFKRQKVLILGGGFGGIKAALELSGHQAFEVTLISDQSDFRYYPTLFHAAVGGKPTGSSIPLAEIFENKDVQLVLDTAKKVDRKSQKVKTAGDKTYAYDVLIVALGVVTNYFGIEGLAENSFGIKTQAEAQRLKKHLHDQLLHDLKPDFNYVVIGGGPTGVELAGALPAYIDQIVKNHGLQRRKIHVDLVEAAPRLMPRMPKPYSRALAKQLRKLGVRLYLGKTVEGASQDSLTVAGKPIRSHTIVWTAGVTNHPFLKDNAFQLTNHGKAFVDQYLCIEPNIYVIGDNANTKFSGMAQTALHDGRFIAHNLIRQTEGHNMKAYKPKQPVYVAPAGHKWAAVMWRQFHVYGWLGWLLRDSADFVGFHDYEPWWKASKHWLAEHQTEESCPVCKLV
jgi:NADH dehydrogenase